MRRRDCIEQGVTRAMERIVWRGRLRPWNLLTYRIGVTMYRDPALNSGGTLPHFGAPVRFAPRERLPHSREGADDMRGKWLASIGLGVALACLAGHAQTPAKVLPLDFKADVQADGSLANVEPDAALMPSLQALVRKQVAGWRYAPGTWQGKPVPKRISQRIVAEVVPAANGGFALRIKEVMLVPVVLDSTGARAASTRLPPRYPAGALSQGI